MNEWIKKDADMWEPIEKNMDEMERIDRRQSGYWRDAWNDFRQRRLAVAGLLFIAIMLLTAVFAPAMSRYDYSDQNLKFSNLPPLIDIYPVGEGEYVYVHKEYKLFTVSEDGEFIARIEPTGKAADNKKKFEIDGKSIAVDYSPSGQDKLKGNHGEKFILTVEGREVFPSKKVLNRTYWFGSDASGRDLFVRVLFGARISLLIALVATIVNLLIGVLYGGISGLAGGRTDESMMRFIDILSAVPMILYVILLTVTIGSGINSIIIAIGLVYWVRMARIVRGQILSLKKMDYVLAARVSGASRGRILLRHLLPNAMGPIMVAMTMMVPGAIFTEAFLSFIGLGVSPPMASWGTLANDALGGIGIYGYQLFFPAAAICLTMLAFNFVGESLRDALNPRMRR